MQLKRKVVIFGAGKNGEKILQRLGEENVVFFVIITSRESNIRVRK